VATSRHTIELNGQLYDAVTGELVSSAKADAPKVMDGFTKRKAPALIPHSPVASAMPARKHRVAVEAAKPAPKPVKRSATLMRSAVKKPQAARPVAESHPSINKKVAAAPAQRLQRAITSSKSDLVSKFGNSRRTGVETRVAPLPVKSAPLPAAPPITDLRQQIAAVTTPTGSKTSFDRALHQADSHKQPTFKKTKVTHRVAAKIHVAPRMMGVGSGVLAAVLLAGFFWYQNLPNLSMRMAATRAGVSASLPGYRPAGFSMSRNIKYQPGEITVSYHSNSDERQFELTQKKTELSGQQLGEELADKTDQSPLTYQDADKTIYIYDGSNAAWVEEGVLYKIEGDSALSSDQLIRLATSI
jgi:hypothetical protein